MFVEFDEKDCFAAVRFWTEHGVVFVRIGSHVLSVTLGNVHGGF
jgi:hypothetical protein